MRLKANGQNKLFLPSCLVVVGMGLDGNDVNGVKVVAVVPFAIAVRSESVEEEVE